MATEREQAQAEVYRLESDVRSAQNELDRVKRNEKEDRERGLDRVGPAESALANARRALELAKDRLRRL
jgi:uncharacterized protein YlxW (UPF0749 family)